jgi:outer membrane immunogenic protein
MRNCFLGMLVAALGLAASQVSAADLPSKAPAYIPPPARPITWTGCYVGGNIGGIFSNAKADFGFADVSNDTSTFAVGGQIGCDYQFSGGWVLGFRNMLDWTDLNRDRAFVFPTGIDVGSVSFKTNWFDALTARLGYSWSPNWLLYGQGGVAWANNGASVTINGLAVGDFSSKTRTGWTAGGGVEWLFAPGWSAFLEGNFMDFGNQDRLVYDPVVCTVGCPFNTNVTAATALVGVNYRFGY